MTSDDTNVVSDMNVSAFFSGSKSNVLPNATKDHNFQYLDCPM